MKEKQVHDAAALLNARQKILNWRSAFRDRDIGDFVPGYPTSPLETTAIHAERNKAFHAAVMEALAADLKLIEEEIAALGVVLD